MTLPARSAAIDPRPGWAIDCLALVVLKLAVGACVLHAGFSHVSDDDYARTVIAQQFAHAPRLDPSGTSWLPLPFWLVGFAMIALGRSLAVARGMAIGLGALSVAAPYGALRATGVRRAAAFLATAVTMALPWSAWLGVATVPEAWTGAIAGAAMIALPEPSAWVAVTLLAASLSRYDPWPICGIGALAFGVRAVRGPNRGRAAAGAVLCVAGPLLWLAWNAHAHGSAFHFLARVSSFRRSMGAAAIPLRDKWLGNPLALVNGTPEAAGLGLVGLVGLIRYPQLRRRWNLGALAIAASLAFLIAGDLRDGAPTHHPERALSSLWWVLVAMGCDALSVPIATKGLAWARRIVVAAALVAWTVTLPVRWRAAPGMADAERRDTQVERGLEMRRRSVQGAVIQPCAFEHFALLAAWGEPERATLLAATHTEPSPRCPLVQETPAAPVPGQR